MKRTEMGPMPSSRVICSASRKTGWLQYSQASLSALRLKDAILATLKTVAFGYLTGTAGCYFGLAAEGGTEGVGRAADHGIRLGRAAALLLPRAGRGASAR